MGRKTAFEMCLVIFLMASVLTALLWYADAPGIAIVISTLNWAISFYFFIRSALKLKSAE